MEQIINLEHQMFVVFMWYFNNSITKEKYYHYTSLLNRKRIEIMENLNMI